MLRKIFLSAHKLLESGEIQINYDELVDYCFEVYNIISTITADNMEKEKIINLTISSLKRGAKTFLLNQKVNPSP